jgi:hypothetical protein
MVWMQVLSSILFAIKSTIRINNLGGPTQKAKRIITRGQSKSLLIDQSHNSYYYFPMIKKNFWILVGLVVFSVVSHARIDKKYVISLEGISPLKIGMTGREAAKISKSHNYVIKGIMHFEGGEMLGFFNKSEEIIAFQFFSDDLPKTEHLNTEIPIDLMQDQKISLIYSNNPQSQTAAGIHPGSTVVDAEKYYGKAKIVGEENLYIEFAKHPKGDKCALGFIADGKTVRDSGYNHEKNGPITAKIKISAIQLACK